MQANAAGGGGGSYNSNTFSELKSHSSKLFNEQLNILLYMLNMRSMEMNMYYRYRDIIGVKSIAYQIYKNIRCLSRFNSLVRYSLNLETQEPGVYTTDVLFYRIDEMIEYCNVHGWTYNRTKAIIMHLNNAELILRDILQYFSYFMRPDFQQKPDISESVEKYKQMADRMTIEKLRQIVGKRHHVDFEGLEQQTKRKQEEAKALEDQSDDTQDDSSDNELFAPDNSDDSTTDNNNNNDNNYYDIMANDTTDDVDDSEKEQILEELQTVGDDDSEGEDNK